MAYNQRDVQPINSGTSGTITSSSIQDLWNRHYKDRQTTAIRRIEACRAVMAGEKTFSLPEELDIPDAENLIITLPQKVTIPLKTINVLGRKRPKLRRESVGLEARAVTVAD